MFRVSNKCNHNRNSENILSCGLCLDQDCRKAEARLEPAVKLTHEHSVRRGISHTEVFIDVPHQSHDHHGVHCDDVTDPAVQHPVLQDEPEQEDSRCHTSLQQLCSSQKVNHDSWFIISFYC